jgi:hypothetical protein
MLKFCVTICVLICCGSVHAEDVGPWFGSEVTEPEQVSAVVTATNVVNFDQNQNCTIYSCSKLKKIAKPELKSASNP